MNSKSVRQAAVLSMGGALLLAGCGVHIPGPIPGTTDPVCVEEMRCYDEAIASFPIRPDRAVELVNSTFLGNLAPQPPAAIIGDWYLFSFPLHHTLLLDGYYVNGKTGQVEYREPPYELQGSFFGFCRYVPSEGPDNGKWTTFAKRTDGARPDINDVAGRIRRDAPYYADFPVRGKRDASYPYYVDDGQHKPDGVLREGTRVARLSQRRNYILVWTKDGSVRAWVLARDVSNAPTEKS